MELKRSLEGHLPEAGQPVCVEILMETSEVYTLWQLSIETFEGGGIFRAIRRCFRMILTNVTIQNTNCLELLLTKCYNCMLVLLVTVEECS